MNGNCSVVTVKWMPLYSVYKCNFLLINTKRGNGKKGVIFYIKMWLGNKDVHIVQATNNYKQIKTSSIYN